jgi:4-hydroxybenzoate polyprenyltransferase
MAEPGDGANSTPVVVGPLLSPMRVRQWLKNLLVILPLVLIHDARDPHKLSNTLIAFAAFCLCASAIYLFNDVIDIEADHSHPRKRHRPLTAGTLPVSTALAAAAVLLVIAVALALLVNRPLLLILLLYAVLTIAYSL